MDSKTAKKFHDARLDATKTHTPGVYKNAGQIEFLKSKGLGIDQINRGVNRFEKHGLAGQTAVTGKTAPLGESRSSLLDGSSARDYIIEKPKDDRTEYEKKIDKIKEAFRHKQ